MMTVLGLAFQSQAGSSSSSSCANGSCGVTSVAPVYVQAVPSYAVVNNYFQYQLVNGNMAYLMILSVPGDLYYAKVYTTVGSPYATKVPAPVTLGPYKQTKVGSTVMSGSSMAYTAATPFLNNAIAVGQGIQH